MAEIPVASLAKSSEQRLLDAVARVISPITCDSPLFSARKRLIKDLFIQRDFSKIFCDPNLLPTYAAEYLGGRALAYRTLFGHLVPVARLLEHRPCKIACLGAGNGAELCGLVSAVEPAHDADIDASGPAPSICVTIQDWANYGVVPELFAHLQQVYGDKRFTIQEDFCDLLQLRQNDLSYLSDQDLITCCFVLNEILSTSKKSFAALLTRLVTSMKRGALLLVVDPASSFSEFALSKDNGRETAAHSTHKLFTLLDAIQAFECIERTDSQWYRFPPGLDFPLKLNNMRYFLRLYKKK
ncbi:hypothetical protein HDV03_002565 [Kappamyces sp. JEL0829]|nr:hypothetical protein HDV03_002565 [Kappamyces sp. JEL0829]